MRVRQGTAVSRDGTSIAYRVIGDGRPLFCCNGLGVSPYFWRHLVRHFGNDYQIILWECRGHGKSGVPPNPMHLRYEDIVDDGLAVLTALDARGAVGIGHSAGFQILCGLQAKARARFAALISFLGTAGNALRFFFDSPMSRVCFDLFYLLAILYPHRVRFLLNLMIHSPLPYPLAGALHILTPGLADRNDLAEYLTYVQEMDPRFFATLTQGAEAHSAFPLLRKIRVPTLLIAGECDRFVPLRVARHMHDIIPKSELFVVTKGTHFGLMEVPDVFNLRLEQFLARHKLL
ncbi:MAG: alpha/beta hydrolase [Deltaproteobacteria bacterium]|nr:alpha/beta hydrolase [Deltaproteobacteria bacterium]